MLKKKIYRNWALIEVYLSKEFTFPGPQPFTPEILPAVSRSIIVVQPITLVNVYPLKTRTKKDCSRCFEMKKCNFVLHSVNKMLRLSSSVERSEKLSIKKKYKVNIINQSLQRKDCRIYRYKDKISNLQKENESLHRTVKKFHIKTRSLTELNKKNKTEIMLLEKKLLEKEAIIKKERVMSKNTNISLDNLYAELEELKKQDSNDIVTTRCNKKQFNTNMRITIYRCLENNVAVDTTSKVILACVTLLTNQSITDIPTPATISQMGREISILAELQVVETIINSQGITLAFDATTLNGIHINEIHIVTKKTALTASITALPGGRADDYVQHILDTVEGIAVTYSAFNRVSHAETKQKIYGSILCTLTDRASVNHAAIIKLNDVLDRQLLELHCHLHPLDGIANEVRKELKKFNLSIASTTFGRDCRVVNLLYSISKLR